MLSSAHTISEAAALSGPTGYSKDRSYQTLQPTVVAAGGREPRSLSFESFFCLLFWVRNDHGLAEGKKRAARRTDCSFPWYHQILPLCSFHLLLSAFDESCVRQDYHWLSFSAALWMA